MTKKTRIKKKLTAREKLEKLALSATSWLGSIESLFVHTLAFVFSFSLVLFGRVLLVLTTVLSLEAIYLAIFIQMSVNQSAVRLAQVESDIEDIAEDVEEIAEDVEGIEKGVEEISDNVEEIQEDMEHIEKDIDEIQKDVDEIQEDVEEIQGESDEMVKK
jgi:methyl-accepting chemotaxis protein